MSILAAEEAHNPLIPPWGEIIIGLIAFAIVYFVFAKFVAPRFEQVYRARREAIEGGIERAEAMQAEAKAALEQYRAQLERLQSGGIRSRLKLGPEAVHAALRHALLSQRPRAHYVVTSPARIALLLKRLLPAALLYRIVQRRGARPSA